MQDPKQPKAQTPAAKPARRPYQKPGFVTSLTFERSALSCGANLMNAGPPFDACSLQS
jgi:hypothetical protein